MLMATHDLVHVPQTWKDEQVINALIQQTSLTWISAEMQEGSQMYLSGPDMLQGVTEMRNPGTISQQFAWCTQASDSYAMHYTTCGTTKSIVSHWRHLPVQLEVDVTLHKCGK